MREVLRLETIHRRIADFLGRCDGPVAKGVRGAVPLLQELRTSGELKLHDAFALVAPGSQQRHKRNTIAQLAKLGLVVRQSPRGPLRLGLPADALPTYFPRLYPDA